jgi:PKD repeat protein
LHTDSNGQCRQHSDTLKISLTRPPVVNAGIDQPICDGTKVINLDGKVSDNKGQWKSLGYKKTFFFPDTILSNRLTLSSQDISAGAVKLVLETRDTGLCLTVRDTMEIKITTVPEVLGSGYTEVCANNNEIKLLGFVNGGGGSGTWTIFKGKGKFKYSPDTLNNFFIPDVSDTSIHKTILILKATNSCVYAADTVVTTITPAPYVYADSDQFFCSTSDEISLKGVIHSGATKGRWSTDGDGDFENDTLLVTKYHIKAEDAEKSIINFYLTSTDNGKCKSITDTTTVYFKSTPKANFIFPVNMCRKTSTLFKDSSTVLFGKITGYKWKIEGIEFSGPKINYIFNSEGNKEIEYEITTDKGCNASKSKNFFVRQLPTADFTYDPKCDNTKVQFKGNSAETLTWNWNFGNGNTGTGNNPVPQNYSAAGDYKVSTVFTDPSTCTDTITKDIRIYPSPNANFNYDNICDGYYTRFKNRSTITGDTLKKWKWYFGDGDSSNLKNPNHQYMTIQDSVKIVMIAFTMTCSDTIVRAAEVQGNPEIVASDTAGCSPMWVTFSTPDSTSDLSWYFGDGSAPSPQNPSNKKFINESDSIRTFRVKLIALTEAGCIDSSFVNIKVRPNPAVKMGFSADSTCSNKSLSFSDSTLNRDSSKWYLNDEFMGTNPNPTFVFVNPTSSVKNQKVKLVTITNFGCSDSTIKDITVYGIPVNQITLSKDTACHNESVKISAISGGSNYEWHFGDGEIISGAPVTYHAFLDTLTTDVSYNISLVFQSLQGCVDTFYNNIIVKPAPSITFTASSEIGCTPLDVTLSFDSTGIKDYKWSFSDSTTSNLFKPNHKFVNPGLEQKTSGATLEVTNYYGCKGSTTETFSVYPLPEAHFKYDTAGCSPFKVKFENTSVIAEKYKWTFSGGNTSSNDNPEYTYVNEGTVTLPAGVKLLAISAFGCKDSVEYNDIKVHPQPQSIFTLKAPSGCSTFEAVMTNESKGASSYKWIFVEGDTLDRTDKTTEKHNYRNISNKDTTYFISLISFNSFGCPDTVQQSISVSPAPESNFTVDTTGCSFETFQFTNESKGAKTYEWDFGDFSSVYDINPEHKYINHADTPVTYFARLTTRAENPECFDVFEKRIKIFPIPKANFIASPTSGCTPFSVTLVDSTKNAVKFYLDFGNGDKDTSDGLLPSYNYTNSNFTTRDYKLSLIVESEGHCFDTITNTVSVYPSITARFSPADTAGCSPFSMSFKNLSEKVVKYEWKFGDGPDSKSGLENPSHTYVNASTEDQPLHVMLVAESYYGCKDTAINQVEVYAMPNPKFEVSPKQLQYPNTTVNLTNKTEGNWSYEWDFGDKTDFSSDKNPGSHTYTKWGNFLIILKAYDKQCEDTVRHPVLIETSSLVPAFDIDTPDTWCAPCSVTFVNKSVGGLYYEWNFGDGSPPRSGGDSIVEHIFQYPDTSFEIVLTATDENGSESVLKKIEVFSKPNIFFQVAPREVEVSSDLSCYNMTNNAVRYYWKFGDGDTSLEFEPKHKYQKEGSYRVTLYAWSDHQCVDSFLLKDPINVIPGCDMLFPNAFTPNTSGPSGGLYNLDEPEIKNDIFHPLTKNIIDYKLEIYNRWGEMVYQSKRIDQGWDGYYKGVLSKDDVYIWKAKARCNNGKLISKTGTVMLVR